MKWLLLAPIDFIVSMLAFPLAPIIVLFTTKEGASPYWCWPWLTQDNSLDGDDGHWERWPDNGTKWRVFCRRVAWLWRNRGYGFSYYVCGANISGESYFLGNRKTSDNPMSAGVCFAYNSSVWEIYAFIPYTPWIGLRIRLGWDIPLTEDSPCERSSLKLHINPFKGYVKKG